jgi:hypothetical protein
VRRLPGAAEIAARSKTNAIRRDSAHHPAIVATPWATRALFPERRSSLEAPGRIRASAGIRARSTTWAAHRTASVTVPAATMRIGVRSAAPTSVHSAA